MAGFAHSVQAPFRGARMSGTLAPVAGLARLSGSVDDSALARRAAAGDGDAFAALYEIPESATPMGGGVGGGGTGFDPGDPEDDPERNVLLEARNEEIRAANLALPERQREVLALRELEELSYDEIAELMEMNRNSVAQLVSRARINLRDALRGTALASIS